MKGFAIGRVLEPEHVVTQKGAEKYNFGLLVGKASAQHDIWKPDDGKSSAVYEACTKLKDGDLVIVTFGSGVGKDGRLREYINDIRLCPADIPKRLREVFAEAKGA